LLAFIDRQEIVKVCCLLLDGCMHVHGLRLKRAGVEMAKRTEASSILRRAGHMRVMHMHVLLSEKKKLEASSALQNKERIPLGGEEGLAWSQQGHRCRGYSGYYFSQGEKV
jgi:hypothetical protein